MPGSHLTTFQEYRPLLFSLAYRMLGSAMEAEDIPLQVVYEDDDLLVVNKPAGLVVHFLPPAPVVPAV